MTDGIWTMHDDGGFELQELYATWLSEAKIASARAWMDGLAGYLEPKCPYTAQQLADELAARNERRGDAKALVFDEFVLEALSGDL